eukprot:scaffold16820_cov102-Isochrysis_galbana.AAC.3
MAPFRYAAPSGWPPSGIAASNAPPPVLQPPADHSLPVLQPPADRPPPSQADRTSMKVRTSASEAAASPPCTAETSNELMGISSEMSVVASVAPGSRAGVGEGRGGAPVPLVDVAVGGARRQPVRLLGMRNGREQLGRGVQGGAKAGDEGGHPSGFGSQAGLIRLRARTLRPPLGIVNHQRGRFAHARHRASIGADANAKQRLATARAQAPVAPQLKLGVTRAQRRR